MLASAVFNGPPAYLLQPATATATFYILVYAIWTAHWFCAVTSLLRTPHVRQALFPADYSSQSCLRRLRLLVTAISQATPLLHGLFTVVLIVKAVAGNLVAVSVWLHSRETTYAAATLVNGLFSLVDGVTYMALAMVCMGWGIVSETITDTQRQVLTSLIGTAFITMAVATFLEQYFELWMLILALAVHRVCFNCLRGTQFLLTRIVRLAPSSPLIHRDAVIAKGFWVSLMPLRVAAYMMSLVLRQVLTLALTAYGNWTRFGGLAHGKWLQTAVFLLPDVVLAAAVVTHLRFRKPMVWDAAANAVMRRYLALVNARLEFAGDTMPPPLVTQPPPVEPGKRDPRVLARVVRQVADDAWVGVKWPDAKDGMQLAVEEMDAERGDEAGRLVVYLKASPTRMGVVDVVDVPFVRDGADGSRMVESPVVRGPEVPLLEGQEVDLVEVVVAPRGWAD
ncbi:hypothetical protein GGF32_008005 [Allomyces javanicus]|nr:hypothetical protein GGF32_008005 [Allomyces javanicus]